jgi:hypothetical protein
MKALALSLIQSNLNGKDLRRTSSSSRSIPPSPWGSRRVEMLPTPSGSHGVYAMECGQWPRRSLCRCQDRGGPGLLEDADRRHHQVD